MRPERRALVDKKKPQGHERLRKAVSDGRCSRQRSKQILITGVQSGNEYRQRQQADEQERQVVVREIQLQKQQMQKDLEHLKGFLLTIEKKLGNERFVQNAKPEVLELERKKQSDAAAKILVIEESLKN